MRSFWPPTTSTSSLSCKDYPHAPRHSPPLPGPVARLTLAPIRSDVGCKTVANMIKGKQPEEIRKLSVGRAPVLVAIGRLARG